MLMQMYSVYDVKTRAYLLPFYSRTDEEAIRTFLRTALEPDHPFAMFAADYVLFNLGQFDDRTAQIEVGLSPVRLGSAQDFRSAHFGESPELPLEAAAREVA